MSADLLAEFGSPDFLIAENDQKKQNSGVAKPQSKEALIPGILDVSEVTTSGGKEDQGATDGLWRCDEMVADILFDASTDHDIDEEFGDFEGEQQGDGQSNPLDSSKPSLIDTGIASQVLHLRKGDELPVEEEIWGDYSAAAAREGQVVEAFSEATRSPHPPSAPVLPKSPSKQRAKPEVADATTKVPQNQGTPSHFYACDHLSDSLRSRQGQGEGLSRSVPDDQRPTYVPPPAVLIQVLPKFFDDLARDHQKRQVAQLSNDILLAYRVSGRLMAGRALRWKRDTILSQSMRIGPAAVRGKGGGMKLTTMSKSENLKEEREVADAIQAWDRHAQLFNSTMSKAGARQSMMKLSYQMRPRPVTGNGSITSQYPCALCGLKREEQLPGIDVNVEDSFGEFWIEHWGHLDCKKFWQASQALLPQR